MQRMRRGDIVRFVFESKGHHSVTGKPCRVAVGSYGFVVTSLGTKCGVAGDGYYASVSRSDVQVVGFIATRPGMGMVRIPGRAEELFTVHGVRYAPQVRRATFIAWLARHISKGDLPV